MEGYVRAQHSRRMRGIVLLAALSLGLAACGDDEPAADSGSGDAVKVGSTLVSGALVKATVLGHGRGDKVKIFKLRRRKHYIKNQGHRQNYTEVRIDDIVQG